MPTTPITDPQRVVMLGLDGLVPTLTERFLAEGLLPNLAGLVARGCFTRLRSVIPAQTPANWTTLATGATPGTHGVIQWGTHLNGEPVWESHNAEAFTSGVCKAEYLWEALARQGERSVVFNYAGYPPTTSAATHIDWLYQPSRSYFDLAAPTVYHNCLELNTADPIALSPAEDWRHAPRSRVTPLEFRIAVCASTPGDGPTYLGLVWGRGDGYDTVTIARGRDGSEVVAELALGGWSDWVHDTFEMADGGAVQGAFRFKLVALDRDGRTLQLYRSDAFPSNGRFCSDGDLGSKLVRELGPYVHSGLTVKLQLRGELDWQTASEVMSDEAEWWSRAAATAVSATDSRLLVLHWHNLDAVEHSLMGLIDPSGAYYDPSAAESHWDAMRRYYQAADRFVGAFLDRFDDGATAFAVVSDHGMPANRKAVSLVPEFIRRGWIRQSDDGRDVDWSRSKLFYSQNHLWINLRGRDSDGVVARTEFESLRSGIIRLLRDLKDPDTGEHVMAFVLPREDAPMVGLWGPHIGDVVFCYRGGYRWAGPEVLRMGEQRQVFPSGGGNHGPMVTTFETDVGSVLGTLILAGPGVPARGHLPPEEQMRFCTTDLAPTLSQLLDLDPPAQNEGRALRECLSGAASGRPRRTFAAIARPLVVRPTLRPEPMVLQGDVTDET